MIGLSLELGASPISAIEPKNISKTLKTFEEKVNDLIVSPKAKALFQEYSSEIKSNADLNIIEQNLDSLAKVVGQEIKDRMIIKTENDDTLHNDNYIEIATYKETGKHKLVSLIKLTVHRNVYSSDTRYINNVSMCCISNDYLKNNKITIKNVTLSELKDFDIDITIDQKIQTLQAEVYNIESNTKKVFEMLNNPSAIKLLLKSWSEDSYHKNCIIRSIKEYSTFGGLCATGLSMLILTVYISDQKIAPLLGLVSLMNPKK
jgi:hypothetical protein